MAELLYYLTAQDMPRAARNVAAALHPGKRLLLAHYRIGFHNFAHRAEHTHGRFLRETRRHWHRLCIRRTGGRQVQGLVAV